MRLLDINQNGQQKSVGGNNIMIKRWFHALKYDEVYLKDYENIRLTKFSPGCCLDFRAIIPFKG